MFKLNFWLYFVVFQLLISSCEQLPIPKKEKIYDLEQIRKKGKLTILTENSSLSYFEYRDKAMGFEYEILDTFSRYIGIPLEIKVIPRFTDLKKFLKEGKGDIVAANLAISLTDISELKYSHPYYHSYQVLVQLQSDSAVTEPSQLAGKEVYVRKNSTHSRRLKFLEEEIGEHLKIRYAKADLIIEDLIEQVKQGKIRFTVAHENLARKAKERSPSLDIKTRMSVLQKIAFGLRKNAPELKKELDGFLKVYCQSEHYAALKHQYFDYLEPELTEILPIGRGQLSPYDKIMKSAAKKYAWDWKLLAAIIHKESRFNPYTRGAGGAYGLMQFMPNTGPKFGVYPHSNPEIQINGGMRYLSRIFASWGEIPDKEQRIKFALGSYNAGRCHIEDAQKLAAEHGLNPQVWDGNVALMVEKLADPNYYRSPDVRCGAYRGAAVSYVETVYNRYLAWK